MPPAISRASQNLTDLLQAANSGSLAALYLLSSLAKFPDCRASMLQVQTYDVINCTPLNLPFAHVCGSFFVSSYSQYHRCRRSGGASLYQAPPYISSQFSAFTLTNVQLMLQAGAVSVLLQLLDTAAAEDVRASATSLVRLLTQCNSSGISRGSLPVTAGYA